MVLYYFMRVLASENNIIFMFFFYFFRFTAVPLNEREKAPDAFCPSKIDVHVKRISTVFTEAGDRDPSLLFFLQICGHRNAVIYRAVEFDIDVIVSVQIPFPRFRTVERNRVIGVEHEPVLRIAAVVERTVAVAVYHDIVKVLIRKFAFFDRTERFPRIAIGVDDEVSARIERIRADKQIVLPRTEIDPIMVNDQVFAVGRGDHIVMPGSEEVKIHAAVIILRTKRNVRLIFV